MPGATVTAVARRHGIARGLLYTWRRLFGNEGAGSRELGFVPVTIAGESPAATERVPGRIEIADRHGLRVELDATVPERSEEHTSELQSLMRISYAVFCLENNKLYNESHNSKS